MEKTIRCPNCKKITTCKGNPGEIVNITCPSCGAIGKVTFEDIKDSTSEPALVSLRNISKRYKDILAVDNVSFDIKQGEIFVKFL